MKLLGLTLSLLLVAVTLHAQELSDSETSDLIARLAAARKDKAVQSDFREEKRLAMMDKPVIETGTIAFLPPDKFRREVKGKSLTVCDGKTLWMYYPQFQEAEKYALQSNKMLRESLAAMTSGLGLQDLTRTYGVKAWKQGDGYQVQLTPKGSLRKQVSKITIDLNAALTAQRMEIETGRNEGSVITFSNERKAALSTDDFTFRPPAGVSVSEPLNQ